MTVPTSRQTANRARSLLEWADDHDTLPGGWTATAGIVDYTIVWHPGVHGQDAEAVRAAIEADFGPGEDRRIDKDGFTVTRWAQEGDRPELIVFGTTFRRAVA